MVANLVLFKIDLDWAQDQYWTTIIDVIGEYNKTLDKLDGKSNKRNATPLKASDVKGYLVK